MASTEDGVPNGLNGSTDDADGRVSTEYDHESEDMPHRASGAEMDEQRTKNIAYQYLCHLEEAKKWMEACITEELPPTTELEEGLRNGVYLGKLAHFYAPKKVPYKRIYDKDQTRYKASGLHFRHTDNIVQWMRSMESIGLPTIFYPETTDVYDRKNMPKTVYCLHALSLYLFKLGIAPQIESLYGKVDFTEEEISAMQQELDKYGINMPAFGKIGGILANELSVDDAAVHAAVIAINDAVEKQVSEDTLKALHNPNAMLVTLINDNQDLYQETLYNAKQSKHQSALNKSMREGDDMTEREIYDMLLTQAEIQGNISAANVQNQITVINSVLDAGDVNALVRALESPAIGIKNVKAENGRWYLNALNQARRQKIQNEGSDDAFLDKDELQVGVNMANSEADERKQMLKAVRDINGAIDSGNAKETVSLLNRPEAKLPTLEPQWADLYQEELGRLKTTNEADLTHDQLSEALQVLKTVAGINHAVDAGDPTATVHLMLLPEACLTDIEEDETVWQRYQDKLASRKRKNASSGADYLLQEHVQGCVEMVNAELLEEHERIMAVAKINEALDTGDPNETLQALQTPAAKLREVEPDLYILYLITLRGEKDHKAELTEDEAAVLWLDEIQDGIDKSNNKNTNANKLAVTVANVNMMIEDKKSAPLLEALRQPDLALNSVVPDCEEMYLEKLTEAKENKTKSGSPGSWVCHKLRDGSNFYFNFLTMEFSWMEPEDFCDSNLQLSKEEIQRVVTGVTAEYDRALLFKSNEGKIVTLQSHVRGTIARKAYKERLDFIRRQLPAIIRIQSWLKGFRQRHAYKERLDFLNGQEETAVKLQSYARMHADQKKFQGRLNFFKKNVDSVVKMQTFWRSNKARNDYFTLVKSDHPPVSVVAKFVHLLERNERDLNEELELQELREKVVKKIRSNQQLESDLNVMDIKIGLLVKNRITLQDVVSHGKKLRRNTETSRTSGLKAMSKEKREMLEAYQHLFYLLQTDPHYLAKLIFAMPQSRTTKFMESVILTLYNYAANQREEFLMLKLFKTALEEEITSKVDKMMEIVTGSPMVIKMVVTFNRGTKGQSSLRDILQPLVKGVMDDKKMNINTSPTDVYKAWINQMESQTGEASKLPYDVPTEVALQHKEVLERIEQSVKSLGAVAERFLTAIISAIDKFPYGIRYIAKVLKLSLHNKFPNSTDEEVLKIVGNLIYYRYMNPAIVAPDAFDIIDISVEKGMTNDQRRNLGSVTKVLQAVASGKAFGGESAHLASLNGFVNEAFGRFKNFLLKVCDVPEPEERFNIDEYADFVNPSKPIVYMSVKEIIDTHALLLEHLESLALEGTDPLHELLEDLGEVPSPEDILGEIPGEAGDAQYDAILASMAKTEMSLTLTNKFELQEDDDSDKKRLFIKTKRLLVDVIRCQSGDNVTQILNTTASDEQEEQHSAMLQQRMKQDEKADSSQKMKRNTSAMDDSKLPLQSKKEKILRNLNILEKAGMVESEDHYQIMVNAIAQDIRNQRRYRQRRKQDIVKMKGTLGALEAKAEFYEDQTDYYNQYIRTCLDNLQAKRSSKAKTKTDKKAATVTYNAARLHEKGVILEIEGLEDTQFKNVMFEIRPSSLPGGFDISAKFLGVKMDTVQVVFQDLLQLQYEGASVMNMFGRAKINVNLLIYLLNKKFYGK
ncbi:ras GTPase-activating-like protein IQGAP1 isoform X4 [Asterias rubens]|uniref:ras GTPase-activating-like protein IQGAP1 isoform X3 n=1 Tax=Asterias rubens TaxID=7604 RepID=UPI00145534F7|nr:ras GTPase-activating-like protein IQGAP1 isoform X3 [Asterias rubens]XP_033633684.1 ras GTPase-activating-like protein IQGAP1 isoform X4 [Asterias rubens]